MKLACDTEALRQFCRERGISRLELFGSASREDDFRADRGVGLLCTLSPDSHCTLLEWAELPTKLSDFFGRPVDLVSRWAIERSQNPYRRKAILSTARPIYAEG